jgi:putative oxidoreductase
MRFITGLLFGGAKIQPGGAELGLLILRVGAFGLLALTHGWAKLPVHQGFIDMVAGMGFPYPVVFAWAASLSEFAGALFAALGLFTRPAALLVAFTMSVAAFVAQAGKPLADREMALLYLGIALVYLFLGAGRFSVDALINKRG